MHEGSQHQGGDFTLTELSPEDEKRVEHDYSQHVYEQSPKEPGLQDTFNPAEPWGSLLTRGTLGKRLVNVAGDYATGIAEELVKRFQIIPEHIHTKPSPNLSDEG